ncbi:hypothetical protein EJB05_46682 [Eragrostis curvula]|uniref:Uncharacterized protein n=1 Tax=Eragrostis curvula TaxID=38414 RepID=A0A5J9TNU9_9POAL|nr:hypothetical protein EJB05_46682 [Eragrostis curvula]
MHHQASKICTIHRSWQGSSDRSFRQGPRSFLGSMDDKVVRLVCWCSLVCGFSTALSFVGFVERVVEAEDLENQMLWLAAAQTAAATLALLLSRRHRSYCWWLAMVAHVATASSHTAASCSSPEPEETTPSSASSSSSPTSSPASPTGWAS